MEINIISKVTIYEGELNQSVIFVAKFKILVSGSGEDNETFSACTIDNHNRTLTITCLHDFVINSFADHINYYSESQVYFVWSQEFRDSRH